MPNQKEFLELYQAKEEGTGKKSDMTKLERGKDKRLQHALIIFTVALVILAGCSSIGFWLFSGKQFTGDADREVKVTWDAPSEAASGEMVALTLIYENKENTTLANVDISVHYPEGFYFASAEPKPTADTNNTWHIKNLSAGAAGKVVIKGQLVGEKTNVKSFSALVIYQPENFKNDFQVYANQDILINKSVVSLQVDVPLRVQSGQEIEYIVNYKNISTLPLPGVRMTLAMPESFELIKVEPAPTVDDNVWELDELAKDAEGEIKIKFKVVGESGENKEFKFQLGLVEPDGNYNLQVEKSSLLLIVNPDLEVTLDPIDYAAPGEELNFKLKIKNTSDLEVKNIEVTLNFLGAGTNQKQAVLDKIESLAPQSEKALNYNMKVKKQITESAAQIKTTASISSAEVAGSVVEINKEAEIVTKITSNIDFTASARYYADDLTKLGSGPLPPQINATTTYQIFWTAQAAQNDLTQVQVQTTLPDTVIWEGTDYTEAISYDKKTRQITWNLGDLAAKENKIISFTLSVTPVPDDLNKLLVLTKQTLVNGSDTFTEKNITAQVEQLTTDLTDDPGAQDSGVVVSGT